MYYQIFNRLAIIVNALFTILVIIYIRFLCDFDYEEIILLLLAIVGLSTQGLLLDEIPKNACWHQGLQT